MELAAQIVRFVDDCKPGWVACKFVEAEGHLHTLVDKLPIFSIEILEAASVYPRLGGHRIQILALRSTTLKRPNLLLGFGFLFHFIRAFLRFLRGFIHDFLALLLCGTSGFLDSPLR
jgi:hypothetical protein